MAYCKNCGSTITDGAAVCVNCGASQNTAPAASADKGGFWWGALGCCVPIAGLILWILWRNEKPRTAKAAGVGALVSVIINVVVSIIYAVAIVGLGVASGYSGY